MKIKTIKELMDEIIIIPESELTKEYDAKEFKRDNLKESKLELDETNQNFGQHIGSTNHTLELEVME